MKNFSHRGSKYIICRVENYPIRVVFGCDHTEVHTEKTSCENVKFGISNVTGKQETVLSPPKCGCAPATEVEIAGAKLRRII